MLAEQLRELERDGIVRREHCDEPPPRVEYALTADGVALLRALAPLGAWSAERIEAAAARAR